MKDQEERAVQVFLKSVLELYADIEKWIGKVPLVAIRMKIDLREQDYGEYEAQKLMLQDDKGINVAEMVPVAAKVLGARGRVDMIGKRDKVILLNLQKTKADSTTAENAQEASEVSAADLFKGVKAAGWHWIEDRRRGRAHKLDEEMFYDLLTEVSDYEVR